jgi:DNA polymerase/3'-5' exonuclease PolX
MKFPRSLACQVAREVLVAITPACERVIVAGSLRRRRQEVGDVEILYVSRMEQDPTSDLFAPTSRPVVDSAIALLEQRGILRRRESKIGTEVFGPKNKLMVHLPTSVPVDFFSTTVSAWWNYLVCRTGGKQNNIRICEAARKKGWQWKPYSEGFLEYGYRVIPVASEQEVFSLVGLPYLEPWERQ